MSARQIDMQAHNGCGNSIEWWTNPAEVKTGPRGKRRKVVGRMVGWMSPKPAEGDEVLTAMQSGRTAIFVVTAVEHKRDPMDMFFCDVQLTGYTDGKPIA